ncbi:MAG: hypothetical protein FWE97_04890, partial [Dehalococcoidia bacterium]|nr:hypothetical protein [Dehalococcoidia bacterium]
GVFDIEAVKLRSNAPYLILWNPGKPYHGDLLREGMTAGGNSSDSGFGYGQPFYIPAVTDAIALTGASSRKPLMWDCNDPTFPELTAAKPYSHVDFQAGLWATSAGSTVKVGVPSNINNIYIGSASSTVTIDSITYQVKTAFQLLREATAVNPNGGDMLTWAENLTTIPAETIKRIAREFIAASTVKNSTLIGARTGDSDLPQHVKNRFTQRMKDMNLPYRPVVIGVGKGGCNSAQGQRAYIAADMISMLLGAIGVPGSIIITRQRVNFQMGVGTLLNNTCIYNGALNAHHNDGMACLNPYTYYTSAFRNRYRGRVDINNLHLQFYPNAIFNINGANYDAIRNNAKYYVDNVPKVCVTHGGNIFMGNTCRELAVDVMSKIPFCFSVAYHLDEPTYYCDIIIPEHAQLERCQYKSGQTIATAYDVDTITHNSLIFRPAVVKPTYNTKLMFEFQMELSYYLSDVKGKMLNDAPIVENKINNINTTIRNLRPAGSTFEPEGFPIDVSRRDITIEELVNLALKSFAADNNKGIEWFKNSNGPAIIERPEDIAACYDYNYVYNDYSGRRSPTPAPYTYLYNPYPGRRLPLYNWQDYAAGKNVRWCIDNSTITDLSGNPKKLDTVLGWTTANDKPLWDEYDAEALPKWVDNWLIDTKTPVTEYNSRYDLLACNWKTTMRNLSVGSVDANIWLQEMVDTYDPGGANIHLHPETASRKGIKNGDRIRVISQHTENGYPTAIVEGNVFVTSLIHPDAVGFPGNYGWFSKFMNPAIVNRGANYNQLLHNQPPFILADNGATSNVARVRIEKV